MVSVRALREAVTDGLGRLDEVAYDIAAQAAAAWDAAVCWDPTGVDDFALRRLAVVRPV